MKLTRVSDGQFNVLHSLMPEQNTLRYADESKSEVFHQTNKEHVAQMLFQAMRFAKDFQLDKILDMRYVSALILAHDLPELGMERDFTRYQILKNPELTNDKQEYETKMITELGDKYGGWLQELFKDYDNAISSEAKFVKWLDKYNAFVHMMQKNKIAPYEKHSNWKEDDWMQNCTNSIVRTHNTADFIAPMALRTIKEHESLFVNNKLGKFYQAEKARLENMINSKIILSNQVVESR